MKIEEVAKQLEENNKQIDILESLIKRNKRMNIISGLVNGFILGFIFYLILDRVL